MFRQEFANWCYADIKCWLFTREVIMGTKQSISRRNFLRGAAAVGGTAVLAGLAGCTTPAATTPAWMPTWDETTDVVVVGFGFAGAAAALTANGAGAKVIVLEKAAEADGGSSGCSSGNIHSFPKSDPAIWTPHVVRSAYGTLAEDVASQMVQSALTMPDWFDSVGIKIDWVETSSTAVGAPPASSNGHVAGYEGNEGRFLWQETLKACDTAGIDYRCGMRVVELYQNPETMDILGVKVQPASGNALNIKALKGVVLACGGYGNNPLIQSNFNQPGVQLWPWGTPNNTGDGFALVSKVGAKLWHLQGLEWSAVSFRLPSEKAGCSISTDATSGITPYNHIFVNAAGKRFMNEEKSMNHDIEPKPVVDFSAKESRYVNLPFFMVFDSTMFNAKPLWIGSGRSNIINTYAGVHKLLDWGPDNSKALANGWIFKGNTIEELAANIKGTTPKGETVSVDPAGLAATVKAFNELAASGADDTKFGRKATMIAPVETAPFYAIEMSLSNINTQGGAQRDGNCQVVDWDEKPIPRLFSAGEFGSINGFVYAFGNIFESFTSGYVAGANLAKLDPWEKTA